MLVKLHVLTWTKDHGKALNIILELPYVYPSNFVNFIHFENFKTFSSILFSLLLNLLKYQIILHKLTSKKVDCLR